MSARGIGRWLLRLSSTQNEIGLRGMNAGRLCACRWGYFCQGWSRKRRVCATGRGQPHTHT
jgi:hypothetical protein